MKSLSDAVKPFGADTYDDDSGDVESVYSALAKERPPRRIAIAGRPSSTSSAAVTSSCRYRHRLELGLPRQGDGRARMDRA